LDLIVLPSDAEDQGPPIGIDYPLTGVVDNGVSSGAGPTLVELPTTAQSNNNGHGNGNGNGNGAKPQAATVVALRNADPAPGMSAEPAVSAAIKDSLVENKKTDRYGIVVFCHLRWGFVWQRPQQFLSRFAKKHKILFIEEPFFDLAEGSEPRIDYHKVMPNVTVVTPHVSKEWNRHPKLPTKLREFTKTAIDAMNETGDFDRPVLWYYSPMDSAWSLGYFENRGVVYDCMDELSQFTGAPKALVANEARLIEHADIVFTGGYELGRRSASSTTTCTRSGAAWSSITSARRPIRPRTSRRTSISWRARSWVGSGSWTSASITRWSARWRGCAPTGRSRWSARSSRSIPTCCRTRPTCSGWAGRDYQQLPHYCRAFDVNMMCFANNASTQYINPTKGLEYMATGKPIVSTPVRDVVRQWSDIVYLAKNAEEFVKAAEEALKDPNGERVKRGLALARTSTWEETVANMQRLIKEAIAAKDRRSTRDIEPLAESELEYVYMATQGS